MTPIYDALARELGDPADIIFAIKIITDPISVATDYVLNQLSVIMFGFEMFGFEMFG